MRDLSISSAPKHRQKERRGERVKHLLLQMAEGGPERQAIEAGEVDAIIDYAKTNVVLFPAARQALEAKAANRSSQGPAVNSLLSALIQGDYQRLAPHLEPVALTPGMVLHEPGEPIRFVYFPLNCVISMLATQNRNRTVEVGLVGFDGMVGTCLALGVNVSLLRASVQIGGDALRLRQAHFTSALQSSLTLRQELNLSVCAELTAARQAIVCNAFHMIEERVASRLLMTSARVRSEQFFVTHESLAGVLGVRRVSITQASAGLQKRRLICYQRGHLKILNRKGLEAASCHCYGRLESLSRST